MERKMSPVADLFFPSFSRRASYDAAEMLPMWKESGRQGDHIARMYRK